MDPELAALVGALPRLDLTRLAEARALLRDGLPAARALADRSWEQRVTVTETRLPGPAGAPEVPARVYRPTDAEGPLPALVYFHGGAFCLGELDLFDTACGTMAARAGVLVVSVDYRLAPEHPFPAPPEDCYAALVAVASAASELNVDPARIAIGGASAGGGLAAATALMARDRGGPAVAFQLLNYPVLDDRMTTVSARTFTETPMWDTPNTAVMWQLYLGDERQDVSPYAAPARATDLGRLPPAYVLTCEFDPLRDEGIAYAARLLEAGVPVELHQVPGTFHAFDAFPAEVARAAVAEQIGALRRALQVPAPVTAPAG